MEDEAKSLAKFISENPYPVLRISKEGILLYANAASVPFLMDWNCKIGEPVPEEWKQLVSRVLEAAFRESVDLEHKGQFFHFVVVPIKDAGYVNVYGLDVTENKRAWEKIRVAYTELKETQSQLIQAEKMHVVGRLASGVAHEVKNPLATLLQGVEYLMKKCEGYKKDEVYPVLKMMQEAVERADSVIKGLLDFSRVSEMKVTLGDLNAVIESALLLVRHQFNQYHVEVVRDLDKNAPKINIDRNKIEQVFVNIFLNAIYAMPEGGKLTVKTYSGKAQNADEEKDVLFAEIIDEGSGIPEAILDKVFDPFFTTRRSEGGSGLGLSIVRNIIESHKAKIDIKNNKDRGVTVTMVFSVS